MDIGAWCSTHDYWQQTNGMSLQRRRSTKTTLDLSAAYYTLLICLLSFEFVTLELHSCVELYHLLTTNTKN